MNRTEISTHNPDIFFDRELSWLDFNFRVLEEAEDVSNPILERLKFLCITESNLDEFYMVRVAGLKNAHASGNDGKSLNGKHFSEIIQIVSKKVANLLSRQHKVLSESILPELKSLGIHIIKSQEELTEEDILFLKIYYDNEVSSILTPLAIDTSHPFPHILNKTLNLAITLCPEEDPYNENKKSLAVVQVPALLPRFLQLKEIDGQRRFFPLESIIELHLEDLFFGMVVKEVRPFRIIRDSDIELDDGHVKDDLLTSVKLELKNRIWGDAVKLDIHEKVGDILRNILKVSMNIEEHEIFYIPNFVNLTDLMYFYNLNNTSHLKFSYMKPKNGLALDSLDKVFGLIRKEDQLLHHPYDTFQDIENLLKFASTDPKVLAIKMTLYRTSGGSPIIEYLKQAAENGKQVTVLVELKARFDEERNIQWAQKLEDSGVHVIYGFVGLKIHCKLLLIVRRETDMLRRYVHLGTGNYNSATAKYYTDVSLLTTDGEITNDAIVIFNAITSFAKIPKLRKISVAPYYLKNDIISHIKIETENAIKGLPAKIIFKMNSLVDPDVIVALYEASSAGVTVELIIRGICCLKPGLKGISENISVRSIIGRFLEHSRFYIFHNAGDPKVFLASADSMPRNFNKRIETMFPIIDSKLKDRIYQIVDLLLKDNVKARVLQPDGTYIRLTPEKNTPIDSQILMQFVDENIQLSK
jgi:polyphosphate kinase